MTEQNGRVGGIPPGRVMRHNLSNLGGDVITLLELQAELLQVDVREWSRSVVKSLAALAAALVVMLASLPVLLISLGYFIEQWTELSIALSMLAAAGVGVVLAAILAVTGAWLMKRQDGMLNRFSSELKRNISWLKQVISNPTEPDSLRAS